jgi:hypothetical protein
MRWTE